MAKASSGRSPSDNAGRSPFLRRPASTSVSNPGDQLIVLTDPAQGVALLPLARLLERAPKDDPLAMLVRSVLGGQVPSAPEPGAGDPAPASDSSAAPEEGSASEAGVPSNPSAPSPAAETSSGE